MSGDSAGRVEKRTALTKPKLQYFQFLTYFKCHRIPKILFTRAARSLFQWDNDGELKPSPGGHSTLRLQPSQSGVHLDIITVIQEAENSGIVRVEGTSWSQWYTVKSTWKKRTVNDNTSNCAKSNYFVILGLAIHAFPEAWCEICWEEVENILWGVIESTCVPFLGVLDEADIKEYLAHYPSGLKRQWLILLLKLLLRLWLVMKNRTPPNFPSLISQGIELLRGLGTLARADVSYFELGASIVAIRNLNEREPWFAAEELKTLGHNGSKRSNASIGFALASLPTSWMTSDNRSYWGFMQWSPLSTAAPSTMEALAQAAFAGAASFSKVPGIVWSALSLESKVLIGFCEATRKTPQKGYEILRDVIEELKQSYGSGSMEFLLSGTTLVNCCNKVYGGKVGEEIGCVILQSLHGSDSLPLEVEFPQQTYYLMAIADAFLGQGNYDEAERLLLRVIEYLLTDNETAMSAKLRLLKMSRRQRRSPLNLDDWKRLRRLADGFHQAPDSLKYEILEELICFLSVLDPKDIPRSPLEPLVFEIVKSMSTFPISEYGGSLASRENLINNIEALQQYKNELNLFSLSGPQLYFCRKIRDRFRHAAVQVAERVGAANWQRFQRIKEMWEESDSSEEIVAQHEIPDTGKSKFYDSGIGSSVGSESKQIGELDSGVPQGARSVLSIRSFMQNEFGATELPPIPVENAEGNRICFICRKILKGVNSESQWRQHAFSDLRPYVCTVEGCDANPIRFSSRSEFAAHLMNHLHIRIWTCPKCGHSMENQNLLQEHATQMHQASNEGEIQIEERRVLRDLSSQRCQFCGQIPGTNKFVGHICHHLEEISLSAVPKEEEDIDEDKESSVMPLFSGSLISSDNDGTAEDESRVTMEKAKQEEEDEEIERQIREMEDAEAEREKKEAELLAKRAAEKAAAKKAKVEKKKIDAAENDRKLQEAEREMERLEDEWEKKQAKTEAKAASNKSGESAGAKEDKLSLASKLASLTLRTDSGASTPTSDN